MIQNILLFLATIASMAWVQNWFYAISVISILLAHEMGHYLTCRYYGVPASWPYFIPMPLSPLGTMGAFIKMASSPNRRVLFDIAIAGPLAGFAIALPLGIIGLVLPYTSPAHPGMHISLGDPLFFKLVEQILFGFSRAHTMHSLHPMALASWLGCLVTALNLLPVGQLDGGHITYAVFGKKSKQINNIVLFCFALWVGLTLTYIVLVFFLIFLNSRGHPPTQDDTMDIGRSRKILAICLAILFAVCFVPIPFS